MIVTEALTRSDGTTLIRRYSDEGFMLRQEETGALYEEAVDVDGSNYTYTEIDILIGDEVESEEALKILLGGDEGESD